MDELIERITFLEQENEAISIDLQATRMAVRTLTTIIESMAGQDGLIHTVYEQQINQLIATSSKNDDDKEYLITLTNKVLELLGKQID